MFELKFIYQNFDAVLCLNGQFFNELEIFKSEVQFIIAADGAANELIMNDINPDVIIGDLDSFNNKNHQIYENFNMKDKAPCFIKIDEQDTNDFEKCLKWIIQQKLKNILIIGFQGGLLEHSVNNLSVLIKYMDKLNMTILENNRYSIPVSKSIKTILTSEEIISIIPINDANLFTKGLRWNLNNESLTIGIREGARNITEMEEIEIILNSGKYLLFINSRYPLMPLIE